MRDWGIAPYSLTSQITRKDRVIRRAECGNLVVLTLRVRAGIQCEWSIGIVELGEFRTVELPVIGMVLKRAGVTFGGRLTCAGLDGSRCWRVMWWWRRRRGGRRLRGRFRGRGQRYWR